MNFEEYENGYFSRELWNVLASADFEESVKEWDFEEEDEIGFPDVSITGEFTIDSNELAREFYEKWMYLAASEGEDVSEEQVIEELHTDLVKAFNIVFNCIGASTPDEGIYRKENSKQWKFIGEEPNYSEYRDILESVGNEIDKDIPSIPDMKPQFLHAVSESTEHELPPRVFVDNLISNYIEGVRAENNAREAERSLKMELENTGMDARTAASIAKNMEDKNLLKTDAELDNTTE